MVEKGKLSFNIVIELRNNEPELKIENVGGRHPTLQEIHELLALCLIEIGRTMGEINKD
jgi:hypothetical protein